MFYMNQISDLNSDFNYKLFENRTLFLNQSLIPPKSSLNLYHGIYYKLFSGLNETDSWSQIINSTQTEYADIQKDLSHYINNVDVSTCNVLYQNYNNTPYSFSKEITFLDMDFNIGSYQSKIF